MAAKLFRLTPEVEVLRHSSRPDETTLVVLALPERCMCDGYLGEPLYGLNGGGFGIYAQCEACDRIYKIMDDDEDDSPRDPISDSPRRT